MPVIRIARGAVMRVDADPGKGKFGHIGAADQHHADGTQAGNRRRVALGGRRVVERLRASKGALAGDIEQVLDRNRQPGERRGHISGLTQAVLSIGRGPRTVRVDRKKSPRALTLRIGYPRERGLTRSRLLVRPAASASARSRTVGFEDRAGADIVFSDPDGGARRRSTIGQLGHFRPAPDLGLPGPELVAPSPLFCLCFDCPSARART
jgi:hypothetical protein